MNLAGRLFSPGQPRPSPATPLATASCSPTQPVLQPQAGRPNESLLVRRQRRLDRYRAAPGGRHRPRPRATVDRGEVAATRPPPKRSLRNSRPRPSAYPRAGSRPARPAGTGRPIAPSNQASVRASPLWGEVGSDMEIPHQPLGCRLVPSQDAGAQGRLYLIFTPAGSARPPCWPSGGGPTKRPGTSSPALRGTRHRRRLRPQQSTPCPHLKVDCCGWLVLGGVGGGT